MKKTWPLTVCSLSTIKSLVWEFKKAKTARAMHNTNKKNKCRIGRRYVGKETQCKRVICIKLKIVLKKCINI